MKIISSLLNYFSIIWFSFTYMSKTFDPFQHFGFLTNRIGRLIDMKAKSKLQELSYDFPPSCIGILADLWQKDGVNQKELGVSLIKTKSSITKMIVALEEAGMIERVVDEVDGRHKKIYLTQKALEFKEKIERAKNEYDQLLLQKFSRKELDTSKKILKELYTLLSIENTSIEL